MPKEGNQRPRVEVTNPADGGFLYWLLKLYLFGGISALLLLLGALPLLYMHIAAKAPQAPNLRDYPARAALETKVYALDGRPLATIFKEHRYLVDVRDVPPMLIKAFMAAEDRSFFSHGGVDFRGILRAAWANLKAGGVKQGGSTITQQVAKAHLSPERTIERKLNELVLARRIEARHSKEEILEFYLNHIFFGNNAYGVKAAAREYFGKELKELRTSEMAMLAGLVRAPSRYSPRRNHPRAKRRRNTVLGAMHQAGYIDATQLKQAKADPLKLARPPHQDALAWIAPHFTEHVRRLLMRRYGKEKVSTAGWQVSTTVAPTLNKMARRHALNAVEALDKRRGWRGPVGHGDTALQRTRILDRLATLYGPIKRFRPGYRYLALVNKVSSRRVRARIGKRKIEIPLDLMEWAAPYSATNPKNSRKIESARGVLHPGDLIWVHSPPRWLRRRAWGGP
ncbi:MAG: transglycosylase domain-containing protein, partial [Deltaproteobacteria bacterium]|nr:transglycosylase domain-containing protein [Deltaproteobacteria bacterium]